MGRKTHLEATPYDRVPSSDVEVPSTATVRRKALPSQDEMEESLGLKQKKRSEQRRQKREVNRNQGKVCFNCRLEGHRAQDCPESSTRTGKPQKQICYRCGKSDHSLKQCRLHPSKGLPFAECFVCKEKGHITSNCPTNGNGIYPDGGSCKICRSVEHLAKDCPIPDEVRLGTIVGTQTSGKQISADSDDFHDLARISVSKKKAIEDQSAKKGKKVVSF